MSLNEFMKKSLVLKPQNFEKKLKIALLSSFTVKGLLETISVKCSDLNIGCTTFEGGYNQYSQDILDSDSNYHKFNADLKLSKEASEKCKSELKKLKEEYAVMIQNSYKSKSKQNRLMFIFSSENLLQAYKRLDYI